MLLECPSRSGPVYYGLTECPVGDEGARPFQALRDGAGNGRQLLTQSSPPFFRTLVGDGVPVRGSILNASACAAQAVAAAEIH